MALCLIDVETRAKSPRAQRLELTKAGIGTSRPTSQMVIVVRVRDLQLQLYLLILLYNTDYFPLPIESVFDSPPLLTSSANG